jgi:hypothetical protein
VGTARHRNHLANANERCQMRSMPGSRVEWNTIEPYCALWGVVDDRVGLYPWDGGKAPDRQLIESQLLTSVFLGEPLFVIDAHLWMSDSPRQGLFEEGSLLRELLASGFVRVISKTEGHLSELAEKMASQIPSYAALIKTAEWAVYRNNLRAIERSGDYKWCAVPDVNFSVGFVRMAEKLRQSPFAATGLTCVREKEFQAFLDGFLALTRVEKQGPRSLWETAAENTWPTPPRTWPHPKKLELMQLANEMYHMNFASCLAGQFSKPLRVQTRTSAIFNWLTTERADDISDDKEAFRDQRWARKKIPEVNFAIPLGWKPTGHAVRTILDAIKGPKEAYRRSYEEYEELIRSRRGAADPAVWRTKVREKLSELERWRDAYNEKLLEHTRAWWGVMSPKGRRIFKSTISWGVPLGSAITTAALHGTPWEVAMVTSVTTMLSRVPMAIEYLRVKNWGRRPDRMLTGISSRRIHREAAQKHVADLPTYTG